MCTNACSLWWVTSIVESLQYSLGPRQREWSEAHHRNQDINVDKIQRAARVWVSTSAKKTQNSWWKSHFLPQFKTLLVWSSKQHSDNTPKRSLAMADFHLQRPALCYNSCSDWRKCIPDAFSPLFSWVSYWPLVIPGGYRHGRCEFYANFLFSLVTTKG